MCLKMFLHFCWWQDVFNLPVIHQRPKTRRHSLNVQTSQMKQWKWISVYPSMYSQLGTSCFYCCLFLALLLLLFLVYSLCFELTCVLSAVPPLSSTTAAVFTKRSGRPLFSRIQWMKSDFPGITCAALPVLPPLLYRWTIVLIQLHHGQKVNVI